MDTLRMAGVGAFPKETQRFKLLKCWRWPNLSTMPQNYRTRSWHRPSQKNTDFSVCAGSVFLILQTPLPPLPSLSPVPVGLSET